jgi:hypothetical protein
MVRKFFNDLNFTLNYLIFLYKIVLRTGKRSGLIRARLIGAASVKGQVITFLDAHCEVINKITFNLKFINFDHMLMLVYGRLAGTASC